MRKNILIGLVILVVISAGFLLCYQSKNLKAQNEQQKSVPVATDITLTTDQASYPIFLGDEGSIRPTVIPITLKNNTQHSISFKTDSCTGEQLGVTLQKNASGIWNRAPEQWLGFCHTGPLDACVTLPSGKSNSQTSQFLIVPDSQYRFSIKVSNGDFCENSENGGTTTFTTINSPTFTTEQESQWIRPFEGVVVNSSEGTLLKTSQGKTYSVSGSQVDMDTFVSDLKVKIKGYLVEDDSPNQYYKHATEEGVAIYPVSVETIK
jgi:hypothetical protein